MPKTVVDKLKPYLPESDMTTELLMFKTLIKQVFFLSILNIEISAKPCPNLVNIGFLFNHFRFRQILN